MEEKWKSLYQILEKIEEDFLDYEKRKDLLPIREHLIQMQEFTVWFLQENYLGLDEVDYEQKKAELLTILRDIISAIEEEDYVLMHDAITYGFMKYLKLFLPEATEVAGQNDTI